VELVGDPEPTDSAFATPTANKLQLPQLSGVADQDLLRKPYALETTFALEHQTPPFQSASQARTRRGDASRTRLQDAPSSISNRMDPGGGDWWRTHLRNPPRLLFCTGLPLALSRKTVVKTRRDYILRPFTIVKGSCFQETACFIAPNSQANPASSSWGV
jgi:hypothetical protein